MTFLDLTDLDLADLAVELWHCGDAETLDAAALLATDLHGALADFVTDWDADAGYLLMPEGDLLAPDGLRA